jgi:hypothetical protein
MKRKSLIYGVVIVATAPLNPSSTAMSAMNQ